MHISNRDMGLLVFEVRVRIWRILSLGSYLSTCALALSLSLPQHRHLPLSRRLPAAPGASVTWTLPFYVIISPSIHTAASTRTEAPSPARGSDSR